MLKRKQEPELLTAGFNAIQPFPAEELPTHHAGITIWIQAEINRGWIN